MSELDDKLKELEQQVEEGSFAIHEIVKTTEKVYTQEWPDTMSIPQDWTGQLPVKFEYEKKP